VPGYNWATRFDLDGEARLPIQPANMLFSADIGSDEYVYRLAFPVGVDEDGVGRPKLDQNGNIVECDISASQVDEASGIAFLGNDASGRAIIAVVDDEQEEDMFIYTLNPTGTGIDAVTAIGTTNLTAVPEYTGSARQVLDLEGITFDANNLDLYLISSNTKRRRYRDVENKLLDPMVYSPTNDYDRRRHVLLKLHLNSDLTSIATGGYTFYEPEDVTYPNNVYFNPTRGLIRTIRDTLNAAGAPYTPQTLGTHLLIAWNTEDTFGTPVNGTAYSAGNGIPGGGTVLGVYASTTIRATHGARPADTWHYYKMWIRSGIGAANYVYREFMTASAQTRPYHTLFINEFLARSDNPVNDWIELFNPMNASAPLANYRIKDAPPGVQDILNPSVGNENLFSTLPPTVAANGFLRLNALQGTQSGTTLNFALAGGGEQIILRPPAGFNTETIDHWVYPDNQQDNRSQGRAWDGGPSGIKSKPLAYEREREAVQFQAIGAPLLPTPTAAGANHGIQRNSFIAASRSDNATIYLSWRWRTLSPAVWDYSPKLHDGHAINIEAIAYRSATEMIIGLRSPLSMNRTNGNALYYRVNNVDTFLPAGGGWAGAAADVTGPQQMNLNDQGIRSIEWCPGIGPGGAGRYLIIGGPANGGPLEKEIFGEQFSLHSWDGNANTAPTRLVTDLARYTIRPEGVDIITVGGQSRVMFVEDRFLASGYGARNAIHWPTSILTSEIGQIP